MPKHTFYIPGPWPADGKMVLPDEEARHAVRVLRLTTGDAVGLVDGAGTRAVARMAEVGKRTALLVIESSEMEQRPLDLEVSVGVSLLKNSGRFETMLEKVAELGAVRVVPLVCHRTEVSRIRTSRAQAILVSAMKQSGGAHLVQLDPVTAFDYFLGAPEPDTARILCHEAADAASGLVSLIDGRSGRLAVGIGPEGGFTDEECGAAERAGWKLASLGRSRLRTETAAIAAMSVIAATRS